MSKSLFDFGINQDPYNHYRFGRVVLRTIWLMRLQPISFFNGNLDDQTLPMKFRCIAKILTVSFVLICSCTKHKDATNRSTGTWSVYRTGNVQYNMMVAITARQELDGFKILSATSTENSTAPKSIKFWFKDWPLTSANYQPVEFFANHKLENNQVGISLTFPGKDTLYSTGLKFVGFSPEKAPDLTITLVKGQLTIDIPMMSSYVITNTYLDSALFKGIISE